MTAQSERNGTGISDLSPIQTFFVARLTHLVEQRDRYSHLVGPDDWRARLIGRAVYSAYRDLSELGLAEAARAILERGRAAQEN